MARADTYGGVLVLGVVGALLILGDGAVDLIVGAVVPTPLLFGLTVLQAGVPQVVLGILLLVFLGLYWDSVDPIDQRAYSTMVALLGAGSFWAGGGFIVGFVLVFAAGMLGIVLSTVSESGETTRSTVVGEAGGRAPPPGPSS